MNDLTKKAYHFAVMAHTGQVRRGGEPYIFHPMGVALQVAKVVEDTDMIAAALLHDVIEDTRITKEDLTVEFNENIANLVQELTIDQKQKEILGKKVYLGIEILKMTDEALLIKLADRFHNVRDLITLDDIEFIKLYYKETIYILEKLSTRNVTENHLTILYKLFRVLRAINTMFDLE